MNATDRFIEGLTRLQKSIRDIEHMDVAARYNRNRILSSKGDFETLRNDPDTKAWRQYRADIVLELNAAAGIAMNKYKTDLACCRKLSIALEQGFYNDSIPLLFDAITEVDSILRQFSSDTIDIVEYVDRLYADCAGSHADKGREMARKLTDDQWEAYKEAKGGKPITATVEKYFAQRSKDAAKNPK